MAQIVVRTHYPHSEDYEWITEMVDINLDEERIKDITSGKGFIIKSPKPIKEDLKDPDGIFSPRFGATLQDINQFQDRYKCQCGNYRSRVLEGEICPICKTPVRFVDDDFSFFGWLVLKEEYHVIHPSLYMALTKFIDNDTFINIITFNKKINKDGQVEEDYKKPKGEPFYGIGMMGFYERFDEIMEFYKNKTKSPGKQEYYDMLMAQRDKIFTHSIPVYTTLLRPYRLDGGELHYEGTNAIFKILAQLVSNINNDTNRMDHKEIIQNQLLLDTQMKIKELFDEINKILSGKKGSRVLMDPHGEIRGQQPFELLEVPYTVDATTWLVIASVICLKRIRFG